MTAGQGNCLGHRLEEVEDILFRVQAPGRVGVCLDTCHLFSAGYDLSTERGTAAVLDEAVRRFGRRRIGCFHLNDSLRPRGARVDRHAEIGRGQIGLPAFRFLVNDARFHDTPAVLETPNPDGYACGLRLLHSLIRNKRPPMPSASSSSTRSKAEDPPSPERVLAELPVRSKLDELLKLARGRKRVLVLTHDNPDPDSIASAVALAFLLEKRAGVEAGWCTGESSAGPRTARW